MSRKLRAGWFSEFIFLSTFRLFYSDEEPLITPPLWQQCQDAHISCSRITQPVIGLTGYAAQVTEVVRDMEKAVAGGANAG